MQEITVTELKARMDANEAPRVIDVREPHEWDMDHITDENVPMGTVPAHYMNWDKEAELVVACRSGGRSGQITAFLTAQGFKNVSNLAGGMLAWKDNINPGFNVY